MMAAPALEAVATSPAFILATEVWIPGPTGDVLLRTDGVYGPVKAFDSASAEHGFVRGEGLPGRAWKDGRPILFDSQQDPAFARAEAGQAGLSAAVAIPVFSGSTLKGVLVMFCGRDDSHVGAIEIWHGDDTPGSPMKLDAGFYGAATAFREVSQATEFQRGQGLPGGVWGAGAPMLMRDLGSSAGFVRSASARSTGLTTALGIPVAAPAAGTYVVTLLSGRATPIARRFELWDVVPGKGGRQAVATLADGLCETEGALWDTDRKLLPWQGAVGRAMATGAPVAEANPATPPGASRYAGLVALPLHVHGEVTRVVAWFH
jgi:hypothetical protein